MKAFAALGKGLENTLYIDLPNPNPKEGEVLVELKASALNHLDLWIARGHPAYTVKYPHVLGSDGAGICEGKKVVILPLLYCGKCDACHRGWVGSCDKTATVGAQPWGTHAEYTAVPKQNVYPIQNLSFEQAAAVPIGALTAYHMLRLAGLQSGQSVLVWGAASSVGSYGIQIAKALGAEVITTASTDKVEKAEKTFRVPVIDYTREDVAKRARELTRDKGVDVVMEIVGPATWKASCDSVKKGGCIVTCGAVSGPEVMLPLRWLYSNQVRVQGSKQGTPDEFKQIIEWAENGVIKPVIEFRYQLSEAKKALEQLDQGKGFGKIVLMR